jgi:phenylpyruvate tautomerase PptA (4-oxalocrotonate tautomerase family)
VVYVRVHIVKDHLTVEQKAELGDKLIAAVAEAENLVNSRRHQASSWVQYVEFERENWYAPVTAGDPDALWQIDVIAPHEYLPTKKDALLAVQKVTTAVRSIVGDRELPAYGPWVHVHTVPEGHWGINGTIPDFEIARAVFKSGTPEEAARLLQDSMGREFDATQIV